MHETKLQRRPQERARGWASAPGCHALAAHLMRRDTGRSYAASGLTALTTRCLCPSRTDSRKCQFDADNHCSYLYETLCY